MVTENQARQAAYMARQAAGATGGALMFSPTSTRLKSQELGEAGGRQYVIGGGASYQDIVYRPAGGVDEGLRLRDDQGRYLDPGAGAGATNVGMGADILGGLLGMGLPGGDYDFGDLLPGGAPFRVPDIPIGDVTTIKEWWTGTAKFAIVQDGMGKIRYFVTKKVKRRFLPDTFIWKEYRPKPPIVIGKELNSRNLNKAMRVFNRYNKLHKKLHKVFPHKRR